MKSPKIILFDVETSPAIFAGFGLYNQMIPHDNILQDWYIISIAWKELGKKRVHSVSVLDDYKRYSKQPNDDYHVVKHFTDQVRDADVLIAHNLKKFDKKILTTRQIYHRIPPLPEIHLLDTLTEIRKVAKPLSNRLDYWGKFLNIGQKIETRKGLWLEVLKGSESAVKEMVHYNKGDVLLLEEFYEEIKPYIKHPHMGAMQGKDRNESCPRCGSDDLQTHKTRYTAAGLKRLQKQCLNCHSYHTFTA